MTLALFSRIVGIVFTPSNFLLLLVVLGVVLQWTRARRWGKALLAAAVAMLLLVFFLPVDDWLTVPLENRFPRPPWAAHVDGVLVLGGGENGEIFAARHLPGYDGNEGQLVASAEVLRHYPDARLIFSGGQAPLAKGSISEASVAAIIYRQIGVAPSRLILENRSRNSWENFVYAKALARPKQGETWLLVTSAMRMPRAMGIAAKLHWHMLPWPSGYLTTGKTEGMNWNASLADRLGRIDSAVHEWAGIVAYRLTGRLGDPSPASPAR